MLAYFSRPAQNAPQRPSVASCADPAKGRSVATETELKAKEAALATLKGVLDERDSRIAELERRKAELKQILKDNGYFNDPRPLERLGMRLISGRNHWKLQYGKVRVTLAKTPSDFRANQNAATEIANRYF